MLLQLQKYFLGIVSLENIKRYAIQLKDLFIKHQKWFEKKVDDSLRFTPMFDF